LGSQLDALRAAGCERIWADTASGKLARRPEWDNCLDHLRAGDELAVTWLFRMARSVRHLTETAEPKEMIAGYWIPQLKSMGEAVEWARRVLFEALARIYPGEYGAAGEIEIRELFESERSDASS
jgi:hypothetical protein